MARATSNWSATRRWRVALVAAATLVLALLAGPLAGAAGAHASVVQVSPGPAAVLESSPESVRIDFTEGVDVGLGGIFVYDGNGDRVPVGELRQPAAHRLVLPIDAELADGSREVRPYVQEYSLRNGRKVYLLAEGRLLNLASAEGHPAAVMDMSFANQALSAEYMAQNAASLEKTVYVVPEEIDAEIARLTLYSRGVEIDALTEEQQKYLASWDQGP